VAVAEQRTPKWIPVLLPFVVGLLGSEIYSLRRNFSESFGAVLASLYYIPIVIAAITLGTRPAVIVALAAGAAHGFAAVVGHGDLWVEPVGQTVLFVAVALMVAKLAEWRAGKRQPSPDQAPEESLATAVNGTNVSETGLLSRVMVGLVRQFRTPVTSIEGAGWVLDDPRLPDDKRQELVGIVRKEAHRLNRVLGDVLDFTQPRRLRLRMIDVSALIDDVIQLANPKELGQRHKFNKNVARDLPALRGDSEQMRQVLLNLVMNAIQATPGGGHIDISAEVENDHFVIAVKDYGQGIPPAAVDKIFDPFFTTREHSLGLGLPVALRIVTEHGGRIAVDCRESDGTCISVILPVGAAPRVR
jgi:signal transduction histidine kinase